MKSKVYFIPVLKADKPQSIAGKVKDLLEKSAILDIVQKDYKVAVKIHFGEEGNTGFIDPLYTRVVCDGIAAKGARAFLADTNTLYRGKRMNSKDHLGLAGRHGFTKEATGAEIVIPDDAINKNVMNIKIDGRTVKNADIAGFFIAADAMVAVSHFKGHILTGFGGALKNIGMGCATRKGKMMQHCDASPVVYKDKCIGCGECEKVCPADAIHIEEKKSVVVAAKCIGCASCIAACPTMAMFIDMKSGALVQEKMVEYAGAVLNRKKGKAGFINFAVKINKECDCWGEETPRISPDTGIFASRDPVSIDRASFDMVLKACGRDVFSQAHPDQDGMIQLKYAQSLGLGSLDYDLITL